MSIVRRLSKTKSKKVLLFTRYYPARRFGMFFAKIPRPIRQNAITEGDLECILTRNCEGTEQLL